MSAHYFMRKLMGKSAQDTTSPLGHARKNYLRDAKSRVDVDVDDSMLLGERRLEERHGKLMGTTDVVDYGTQHVIKK